LFELHKYKSVIFDCDGVVLQSNKIKTKAFADTLKFENKNLVDIFISYHLQNGGVSRYEKFKYFYKNIKKDSNYVYKTNIAVKKYASKVFNHLVSIDYVPGFLDVLNYFNKKKIPCYIVSGGDQQELHKVFKMRRIFTKFEKILGSPLSKFKNAEYLFELNLIDKPSLLFGDSLIDLKIANKYEIDFCFIKQFSEWKFGISVSKKLSHKYIYNFKDPVVSFK
tara:strand:+ start:34773 stop:35438 length:666 start_codon:yes stop_codon:yes gene_type:complete